MGNTTNTEQWAAMERLRFIERAWCLENGAYYESGVRGQRSAVGGRWSVVGGWRLAVGGWWLVVGGWWMGW